MFDLLEALTLASRPWMLTTVLIFVRVGAVYGCCPASARWRYPAASASPQRSC